MDNKLEKHLSQILEKLGGDTTLPENYNSLYFDKLEWWLSKIYEAEGEDTKVDVNTGAFDPTSENPASQKSIYTALMESINDKADKVNTYTKAETDTAIQTAINNAILTALNTAV